MQDVLNGMSPGDAWALHGNPLFNRAAFEGYTRVESNYRQFSGIMAGILVLGAGMPYVVAAAPFLSQGFGLMGGAARTVGSQAYNFAASELSLMGTAARIYGPKLLAANLTTEAILTRMGADFTGQLVATRSLNEIDYFNVFASGAFNLRAAAVSSGLIDVRPGRAKVVGYNKNVLSGLIDINYGYGGGLLRNKTGSWVINNSGTLPYTATQQLLIDTWLRFNTGTIYKLGRQGIWYYSGY